MEQSPISEITCICEKKCQIPINPAYLMNNAQEDTDSAGETVDIDIFCPCCRQYIILTVNNSDAHPLEDDMIIRKSFRHTDNNLNI